MFKPLFEGHRETCYFCDAAWGGCSCNFLDEDTIGPDDEDVPGFWFEEFFITKPNVSECSRFFVDPVAYYGMAYEECAAGDAWSHWPVKSVKVNNELRYTENMETNTIIGYRVQDTNTGRFINHDGNGYHWICNPGSVDPEPISQPDAYRRLAAFIQNHPESSVPTVVPVYRPLTPLETTSRELGEMLLNLTKRHGLDLGLTKDQVERKIAQELAELGANVPAALKR